MSRHSVLSQKCKPDLKGLYVQLQLVTVAGINNFIIGHMLADCIVSPPVSAVYISPQKYCLSCLRLSDCGFHCERTQVGFYVLEQLHRSSTETL